MEGYAARMRGKRIFFASFITAPIINLGRGKKPPMTAKKLLPDDFAGGETDQGQADRLKQLADEQERRRKNGKP